MKKLFAILACAAILTACNSDTTTTDSTTSDTTTMTNNDAMRTDDPMPTELIAVLAILSPTLYPRAGKKYTL